MAKTTFSGPVYSKNGFINTGPGNTISLTADTDLTVATHAGRLLLTNDADGKFTLPSILTGSASSAAGANDYNVLSNLGCTYTFMVQTLATDMDIKTDGTDKFIGYARSMVTTATSGKDWFPAATNDVMTFDGTTTGGIVGTLVRITATASAEYFVEAYTKASGTLATPFADS